MTLNSHRGMFFALVLTLSVAPTGLPARGIKLLNASYDPTRGLYEELNLAFSAHWVEQTGDAVRVLQSHTGSGKQARAVIDGLPADVVTLALAYDIDAIAEHGRRLKPEWQSEFQYNSAPHTSTVVFLVRKGNPKEITDWPSLIRPEVSVITPNPKTSGGARWNYLAAYGYALRANKNDPALAFAFMKALYRNVPILDTGARGATTTFVNRGIGDVLLAWENEAFLAINEIGKDEFEIVTPSISILAEPPVAIVDKVVDRKQTRVVAKAYLDFLFSEQGQEIAARHYFRPRDATVAQRFASRFPEVKMFTLYEVFGSWKAAHETHFRAGGLFDQIAGGQR